MLKLNWYAIVDQMPHGTWAVLSRFATQGFGAGSQYVNLIALPDSPSNCGLSGRIKSDLVCFSSYDSLLAIKNHLRKWFLLKTPEGENGPWPWHEPAYVQLLFQCLPAQEKAAWLGPIFEIEVVTPGLSETLSRGFSHA